MEWEEIKKEMIVQKEQAIRDLGNKGKTDREVLTVCAFLRCINQPFEEISVKPANDRFPDVRYGDVSFEVKELMDEGRRRLDEYKRDLEAIKRATCMRDLMEHYTPVENSIYDIFEKIQKKVDEVSPHYSEEARKSANLLVYFNLLDVIVPTPQQVGEIHFNRQNWKSVLVVGSSWALVTAAEQGAPSFIRDNLKVFQRNYGAWDLVPLNKTM